MVALYEVRELVHQEMVEDPLGQRRRAPGDADRPVGERAAAPKTLHVGKTDRLPLQSSVEVAVVKLLRPLHQSGVGGLRARGAPLDSTCHDLSPMLAFDVRHGRRYEQ